MRLYHIEDHGHGFLRDNKKKIIGLEFLPSRCSYVFGEHHSQ